jgi:hypothetical protein
MKHFPYDFNEKDFIISDFHKISRRRVSMSMDRISVSATTEASGNLSEKNQLTSSEGNFSDTDLEYKFSPIKILEEDKRYDPNRDADDVKRSKTKQIVYVKYDNQQKQRGYSFDSTISEGNFCNIILIESDNDDPVREMLKSSILNLYEDNNKQLYDNAVQWKEQKQIQEYKQNYYPIGWNYGDNRQYQGFNVRQKLTNI